ncbi:hypothetical protein PENSPDRAFT_749359 [Peniophora sp. CONT]|nr:hypothetical protein PENSPDRAFT_749359 [Peniophora sp. CONT]
MSATASYTTPCVVCAHSAGMQCSGCQKARYCTPEHQKLAWKKHKDICKLYQAAAKPGGSMPPRDTYCGLCGKRGGPLMKTECCGETICDDYAKYVMFTYSRDSCKRNHDRYTLCMFHKNEGHKGSDWKTCPKCFLEIGDTENSVWFGTNQFNFETLPNPPAFRPKFCDTCHKPVKQNTENYSPNRIGGVTCEPCVNSTAMANGGPPGGVPRHIFKMGGGP